MTDPKPVRQQVLEAAMRHLEERAEAYGDSGQCLELAGNLYRLWHHKRFMNGPTSDGHNEAIRMICLKLARLATGTRTRDTYEDIAGYAALAAEMQDDDLAEELRGLE